MRGKQAKKRIIVPDPKFNSVNIAKLINQIMERGKKSIAQNIVYKMLDQVEAKTKKSGLDVFDRAIKNISPAVEVKGKRIGGSNYQVPVEVRGSRRLALTYRWLLEAAGNKKGKPMYRKLAEEVIDASEGNGEAMRKKENVHKMAEANRAFAHFR